MLRIIHPVAGAVAILTIATFWLSTTLTELFAIGHRRSDGVGGGDGDADHRQQVLRETADHSDVAWSLVTVVYTKRGLGITALEPTWGR